MNTIDFTEHLLKGETIVWSGRPAPGLRLSGRDWLLIPFSLLWGGFAIFWDSTVLAREGPIFMKLWGMVFVVIGLYLVAGRFLLDAWIRGRIHYAITNRRVLISRSAPFGKFTAIGLDRLPDASLRKNVGGRGTIRFKSTGPILEQQERRAFGLDFLARPDTAIHRDRECPKCFRSNPVCSSERRLIKRGRPLLQKRLLSPDAITDSA